MNFLVLKNLDIKRYEIGSDSVVDKTTDPDLKANLKYRKHPSIIAINDRCKGKDTFNFDKVHVAEIKSQILKLNKRKATQSYDIPTRIIIENADIFSDVLKLADITPLHKKGKRILKENYRPVSILPNLSKLYEKIMFTHITKFFETIFSRYQCGFRKGFST